MITSIRYSLHSSSMLFTESGSFRVIVDGLFSNFISTPEPDMRVSSHPLKEGALSRYAPTLNESTNDKYPSIIREFNPKDQPDR